MNVPYTALHFAVYESMKKFLAGSAASPAGAAAEAAPGGSALLPAAAAQAAAGGGAAAAAPIEPSSQEEEEDEEGLVVQLVAGGTAGGLAAAATTPLDVVKTRLQVGAAMLLDFCACLASSVYAVVASWIASLPLADVWGGCGGRHSTLLLSNAHAVPPLPPLAQLEGVHSATRYNTSSVVRQHLCMTDIATCLGGASASCSSTAACPAAAGCVTFQSDFALSPSPL